MTLGDRHAAIRASGLPTAQRLLLYVLDDHLRGGDSCWPSMAALAESVGVSVSRARHLVAELDRAGVVARDRSRGYRETNRYRVNWRALKALAPTPRDRSSASGHKQVRPPASSHMTACQQPHDRLPASGGREQEEKLEEKQRCNGSSIESIQRWARTIHAQEFASLEAGLKRFDQLAHNGWVGDDPGTRLNVLCCWESVRSRLAGGKVRSAGGLFWKMLADGIDGGKWSGGNGDEDAVREFLRQHDRASRKPLAVVTDLAARMRLAPSPELEDCDVA